MRTGSEGSSRTENDLRAALPLLERHAPSADAVLRAVHERDGRRAPGLVRRDDAVPRRWPGWLAPVAAAAAVVGVIIASLAISGVLLHRPAGTGPADSSSVLAKVPPYFVAIGENAGRAVVGATAGGGVRGTIAPPRPYTAFRWVAAAGDGRTFVLAAGVRPKQGTSALDWGPVRFYRLILDRSGHPGRLAALPIPPEKATITGLALSPDGGKLAVSLLPAHGKTGSAIQVFSVATGARREWVWPGPGMIGEIAIDAGGSGSNSWQADNRTLMFEVTTRAGNGNTPGQLRLLDTAAGGSLLASSARIPIPSNEVGWQHNNAAHRIIGIPLITGDGTKVVAPFFHLFAPPRVFGFTITEFSVRTGKPVQVLYQRRTGTGAASTSVWWVNTSGTAMIVGRGSVVGVQTPTTFTPLPPSTQRLFFQRRSGFLIRVLAVGPKRPAGKPIHVGVNADVIAITPDGRTVYIGAAGGLIGTIIPISAATNRAGKPIRVGVHAEEFAITPDGKTLYVSSGEGPLGAVVPISTATNTPGKPIRIGSGVSIGMTPDGKTLYAAAEHKVIPISTATNTPGKPIPVSIRVGLPGGVVTR